MASDATINYSMITATASIKNFMNSPLNCLILMTQSAGHPTLADCAKLATMMDPCFWWKRWRFNKNGRVWIWGLRSFTNTMCCFPRRDKSWTLTSSALQYRCNKDNLKEKGEGKSLSGKGKYSEAWATIFTNGIRGSAKFSRVCGPMVFLSMEKYRNATDTERIKNACLSKEDASKLEILMKKKVTSNQRKIRNWRNNFSQHFR